MADRGVECSQSARGVRPQAGSSGEAPEGFPRRVFLGAAVGTALGCSSSEKWTGREGRQASPSPLAVGTVAAGPVLVGSANALPGMQLHYEKLLAGEDPLGVAIEVVKLTEADPDDHSVGLGGLPNEDGVVQLDAAVMHGPTHNSGAVASIENILHPSEVARLVMERTNHCLIVGPGAYRFARQHGHPHSELLTDEARRIWLKWKESMSERDDRLPPRSSTVKEGERETGTIHCSALAADGSLACTTTTSGLSWKVPGRVGDSPIVGAGLYCDQEAGSAGATGRGESAILANGSFAICELMRQGASPLDAGLEVLRRVTRQAERQAAWQPALLGEDGVPAFNLKFYVLGRDGTCAGVALKGKGKFALADAEGGPRHEPVVALHD